VKVDKEALANELEFVSVVAKHRTHEILNNVQICFGPHGLILSSTNLDISLRSTVTIEAAEEFTEHVFLIPAHAAGFVRELPGEEVEIHLKSNEIVFATKGARFDVMKIPTTGFPGPDMNEITNLSMSVIDRAKLIDGLARTAHCLSSRGNRFAEGLTSVEISGDEISVTATDGTKAAASGEQQSMALRFLIPRGVREVIDLMPSLEIGETKSSLVLRSGNRIAICRRPESSMPDIHSVINKNLPTTLFKFNRRTMIDAFRRAKDAMPEKKHQHCNVTISDGEFMLTTISDGMRYRNKLPYLLIISDGEDVSEFSSVMTEPLLFALNPKYVVSALESMDSEEVIAGTQGKNSFFFMIDTKKYDVRVVAQMQTK
jgi:DNA polymerase III sliding clamp (beta) subunit (PCNA family)